MAGVPSSATAAPENTENSGKSEDNGQSAAAANGNHSSNNNNNTADNNDACISQTLYNLTDGIPRAELTRMIAEGEACNQALDEEIAILVRALADENDSDARTAAQPILQATLTPLDGYWTLSALLGRLRDDQALPSLWTARQPSQDATELSTVTAATTTSRTFQTNPYYNQQQGVDMLMHVWKKIAAHPASTVFRRAVKPDEAPGYTDRIHFPLDWGAVRKLVLAGHVRSLRHVHQSAALIAHNCVQYNGRESDYGRVAREFEAAAEEVIGQTVQAASRGTTTAATAVATTSTTTKPPPSSSAPPGG